MSNHTSESDDIRKAIARHFVMWEELDGPPGPRGQWRCACDLKFGLSDSAIDHVTSEVEAALGARTERVWGVSLPNGVYETGSRESALALAGPAPESGPAVTCLRTRFRQSETPWAEIGDPVIPPAKTPPCGQQYRDRNGDADTCSFPAGHDGSCW